MKKKQLTKIFVVLTLIIAAILALVFLVLPSTKKEEIVVKEPEIIVEEEEQIEDHWPEYYAINDDYVGHIYFESGIINLPFVQGDTNETYYRNDWETLAHDEEGSIFLDYRNNIDVDQNIIIYGHNVYESYEPSKTHKFTPLHLLTELENYETNKYLFLDLKDRIEKYEVAIVYRCKIDVIDGEQYINENEPAFYYTNYSEDEFEAYIAGCQQRAYYDTGVAIKYDDKMLTLQTCYEGSPDKLIISAKLVDTTYKK